MYIGIAAAVAVIVICFLLFKPEFLISGGDGNTRIMSVKPNGDLVLSDNTVQDINTYMANMERDIRAKIAAETAARTSSINNHVNAINNRLHNLETNAVQFNKPFTLRYGGGVPWGWKRVRPVDTHGFFGGGGSFGFTNIDKNDKTVFKVINES